MTFPPPHRYQYEATKNILTSLMDPLLQRYNELLVLARTSNTPAVQHSTVVVECQLAWLVYIIGAVSGTTVSGPMAAKPTDDVVDGDLSRRALQLMSNIDQRLSSTVRWC